MHIIYLVLLFRNVPDGVPKMESNHDRASGASTLCPIIILPLIMPPYWMPMNANGNFCQCYLSINFILNNRKHIIRCLGLMLVFWSFNNHLPVISDLMRWWSMLAHTHISSIITFPLNLLHSPVNQFMLSSENWKPILSRTLSVFSLASLHFFSL